MHYVIAANNDDEQLKKQDNGWNILVHQILPRHLHIGQMPARPRRSDLSQSTSGLKGLNHSHTPLPTPAPNFKPPDLILRQNSAKVRTCLMVNLEYYLHIAI